MFGQHAAYARFRYNRALGEFRAGLGGRRVVEPPVVEAPLEPGEGHHCAVVCRAVIERREIRYHRLWSGGRPVTTRGGR